MYFDHITGALTTTPTPHGPPGLHAGDHRVDPAPAARAIDRLAIPGPRTLLGAIVVSRLILIGLVGGRLVAVPGPSVAWNLAVVAVLVASLAAAGWLALRLRQRRDMPDGSALFVQATVDILLVTALVGFVSGATTSLAAIYVGLVTVYALLLPVGRGLLTVMLATACYVAITLTSPDADIGGPGRDFWTQVGVIAFIGVLITVLGNRLGTAAAEQRSLSAALRQVRLEADEILATIRSGVITVDGEGRLGYINPRGRRILGAHDNDFETGTPVMETLRVRSRELHDAIMRGIRDQVRISRGEAAVRRSDGTLFPVGLSTTTFQRPGSTHPSVTAIFTDISDLKRLQEFRVRTERLEAVAALSASLAHEIRNPLAAIRSAVEQLAKSVGDDSDEQVLANLVMRESERLNRLLSEFLDFSRVRATHFEPLDLLDVVTDAARVIGAMPVGQGINIRVEGQSTELQADADLIHRTVSNLMLNAAQALDGKGTITVTVGEAGPGEGPSGPEVRRVKLVIKDDGPGIPEAVRDHLFEPFVTGRQGGTGLGLAIVQRAVTSHHGVILVDSARASGTIFTIFIPVTWNRESAE